MFPLAMFYGISIGVIVLAWALYISHFQAWRALFAVSDLCRLYTPLLLPQLQSSFYRISLFPILPRPAPLSVAFLLFGLYLKPASVSSVAQSFDIVVVSPVPHRSACFSRDFHPSFIIFLIAPFYALAWCFRQLHFLILLLLPEIMFYSSHFCYCYFHAFDFPPFAMRLYHCDLPKTVRNARLRKGAMYSF